VNRSVRWFVPFLALLALTAGAGAALADEPIDGRAGRAEVRFLEGMIDHHQMAVDMGLHCIEHASSEDVRALCEAVIVAQAPEIAQMQGWLLEWYGITYTPVSMLPASEPAVVESAPAPAAHGGMCTMMGGDNCAMMDSMDMSGMMDMQMQMMMLQMQMMQMMMQHMGMPGMDGMNGMSGMGGMSGMSGMSGMNPTGQMPAAQMTPTPSAMDHSQHGSAAISAPPGMTDPAMTMGMFAGLHRLTGIDYDRAWLEAMIDHHFGALDMAGRVQQWAEHDEINALAQSIIDHQTAEIEQMEALLTALGE
jgi:uncharacterized protein (DUF305 family)